ncbi:MAG: DUF6055 domain-containing protein [Clostridium sp.]|nr:DUF6055 domain-containing protein [Clostridium sp.]MCM1547737.1 DUF6055 domain-containing protein [Ruminococcus sp.]
MRTKNIIEKLTAAFCAVALAVSAAPMPAAEAEEEYYVRDPFYNYGKGYNYYESEHFQFIWGNSGDASKVSQQFLSGNAENLEACWNVYMKDLDMAAPSQSTNLSLRDGKEYKTNIYISGTGLEGMEDDWAYMSYDSGGYAYMFCCVDSMQYDPPSWVLPHEFGHVVTAHQLGWNTNKYSYAWWEAMGNWYREQYLYSDYSTDDTGHGTDFFETYLKNSSLTFPCGRDYYAAWPFLQYLTENPDNMDGYGSSFVKTMLQEGQVDEYPFDMVERLAPADLKDTLGNFAKHIAGLDFANGGAYRARLNELLESGCWNWQQIYTMLEPVAGEENAYKVPTERAPQHAGLNVVPLEIKGGSISVELNGNSAEDNWRACIVQQMPDGSCVYSDLFKNGETMTVNAQSGASAYLTVIATPDLDKVTKSGLPYGPDSEFAENNVPFTSKQQYPYTVKITGADIMERPIKYGVNWWEGSTHTHANGGGTVADSASVDASVYVAPDAMVLDSAKVTGNARIEDHAVVRGNASVSDNAVISGYAIIAEDAVISGSARVDDCASVMGKANISGNARVIESAWIYNTYKMTDDSCAKGMAFCMADGMLSGQAVVDGDWYDDGSKTSSKGTSFGWVCSQSYVDSRPFSDKMMYAYDFSKNNSGNIADKYNSTYMVSNALWSENMTGADNVLSFDGKQYADLDRGALYTDDIDIQLAILPKSKTGAILYLGNDDSFIRLDVSGETGTPVAVFKHGDKTETLVSSKDLELGAWSTVRIILDGDKGRLVINNETAAEGTITIDPSDIASSVSAADKTVAYRLGADNALKNGFVGRADFVRIYLSEAEAPTEIYTEKEEISVKVRGDVNADGLFNVADITAMQKYIVCVGTLEDWIAGDFYADEMINVYDLCLMKRELIG